MPKQQGFPWYTGPVVGPVVALFAGGQYAVKGNDLEWDNVILLATIGFMAGVILALGDLLEPIPCRKPTQSPLRPRQRMWYWLGIVTMTLLGSCFVTASLIALDEGLSIPVGIFAVIGLCGFVFGFRLARNNRGKRIEDANE